MKQKEVENAFEPAELFVSIFHGTHIMCKEETHILNMKVSVCTDCVILSCSPFESKFFAQ